MRMPEITLSNYAAGTTAGVYLDRARVASNTLYYVTSRPALGAPSTIPKFFVNGAEALIFAIEIASGTGLKLFDRTSDAP
jgi:hypothetical protein